MSLFGSSPTEDSPGLGSSTGPTRRGGAGLFDDDSGSGTPKPSNSLFADDNDSHDSPWDMPTPRKQQSRADLIRNLLPGSDVPDAYIETFDIVVREDGSGGQVTSGGVAKLFATARLGADAQARIMSLVAPGGGDVLLGRNEFNVLLALVGLAQEGEVISLDGVDERRRRLPQPKLAGLTAEPVLPPVAELSAKPPQTPPKDIPPQQQQTPPAQQTPKQFRPAMDDPEDDPWGSPDMHKTHDHGPSKSNSTQRSSTNGHASFGQTPPTTVIDAPPLPNIASPQATTSPNSRRQHSSNSVTTPGGWGYFDGNNPVVGFGESPSGPVQNPFGGAPDLTPTAQPPALQHHTSSGRASRGAEENVVVVLMPEKEGVFMFQHHNYEISSIRRGSKVIRRYSDFVWLLDCLHKRYPFRILPLLPPKRVGVNGSHLSNDGAFIEKRRRGLSRFLNALIRHPILSQEQLVVMFLTVPTHQELSVWRKQATISVQDEFTDRALPPGLEDSLPAELEDLFNRTRNGVKRSAELYINVCNIMDRLVKRTEGVAADHARIALSLASLTETSEDTYATDTNEVPLLNDGLVAMSKHLRTCQALMEDESRGWDEGVLEDLKRQRDALVSVREMFERRERLDKDNIPYLERRIQTNENKLANLRSKPEGVVKAGEIDRIAENIIKDKESIVQQHNRSIFVKECIRDELITFQSTQYQISRWNQDWAGERVKYAEMLADNWRRLLDELEGMPLGD